MKASDRKLIATTLKVVGVFAIFPLLMEGIWQIIGLFIKSDITIPIWTIATGLYRIEFDLIVASIIAIAGLFLFIALTSRKRGR